MVARSGRSFPELQRKYKYNYRRGLKCIRAAQFFEAQGAKFIRLTAHLSRRGRGGRLV